MADESIAARKRLIVALDVGTGAQALELANDLEGLVSFFKVGMPLLLTDGMGIVHALEGADKDVFLDLKTDDIGNTVRRTVSVLTNAGVTFLTLRDNASGARAAKEARGDFPNPKLLGVPLLSSSDVGGVEEYVLPRAATLLDAGCDGLIASGSGLIRALRKEFGPDPLIVSPGIRPAGSATDDHKRTATPGEAILAGADYLVVGRPIYEAPDDPRSAAERIVAEIEAAADSG
ncbi:MAG: orotidine-5'-phosphate decarboxylase [Armatimonadetes bacterium]|nr:orotidine-5'-phosphate decarboxylase [Armatimonadota bacterium]